MGVPSDLATAQTTPDTWRLRLKRLFARGGREIRLARAIGLLLLALTGLGLWWWMGGARDRDSREATGQSESSSAASNPALSTRQPLNDQLAGSAVSFPDLQSKLPTEPRLDLRIPEQQAPEPQPADSIDAGSLFRQWLITEALRRGVGSDSPGVPQLTTEDLKTFWARRNLELIIVWDNSRDQAELTRQLLAELPRLARNLERIVPQLQVGFCRLRDPSGKSEVRGIRLGRDWSQLAGDLADIPLVRATPLTCENLQAGLRWCRDDAGPSAGGTVIVVVITEPAWPVGDADELWELTKELQRNDWRLHALVGPTTEPPLDWTAWARLGGGKAWPIGPRTTWQSQLLQAVLGVSADEAIRREFPEYFEPSFLKN